MPGFTKISMYPKLIENLGISYIELLDKLIVTPISSVVFKIQKRFGKENGLEKLLNKPYALLFISFFFLNSSLILLGSSNTLIS